MLTEHYAGAFPTWLAPVQVAVLPVSEKFVGWAEEVVEKLKKKDVRVKLDDSAESLGKKIRNAEKSKVPWMLVIGEKEVKDKSVAARNYHTKDQDVMDYGEFEKMVLAEISERVLP